MHRDFFFFPLTSPPMMGCVSPRSSYPQSLTLETTFLPQRPVWPVSLINMTSVSPCKISWKRQVGWKVAKSHAALSGNQSSLKVAILGVQPRANVANNSTSWWVERQSFQTTLDHGRKHLRIWGLLRGLVSGSARLPWGLVWANVNPGLTVTEPALKHT